jgi:hypothetical protein
MIHFRAKALTTSALAVALVAMAVPSAFAGTTPAQKCTQAIAKSLSKGVKKTFGAHAKCYKGTGSDCDDGDSSVNDALNGVQSGIQGKCTNDLIVEAGYGNYALNAPNPTLELARYFKDLTDARIDFLVGKTFASYGAADDDGK